MILRRILIILSIVVITSIISSGLLLVGNLANESISEIYTKVNTNIKGFKNKNTNKEVIAVLKTDENIIDDNESKIVQTKDDSNYNKNINKNADSKETIINNNFSQSNRIVTENIDKQDNNILPKEDVYTFVKNDKEIQNMIAITKRLIIENKENRYSGLIDNINNIKFIVEKSGNVFYPLYEYRIANIVIDNCYPEFYVYAEDVYKNGEFLRTEYYFQ